jgi:MerR family transcriptional regulator, copper efflux regulator
MEPPLTIGQLAVATHLSAKTIRYYERVGVLPAARRNASGYRQYARADIDRLQFVRRARALRVSLAQLKVLTAEIGSERCATVRPRLRDIVTGQLRAVQQQIVELQLLEEQLGEVLKRLESEAARPVGEGCRCLDGMRHS